MSRGLGDGMPKLIIDTNVLLLLIIGRWDRDRIPQFRRTQDFSAEDYDALESYLARYGGLIVTPALLTEVSNLMGNTFHETVAETIVEVCQGFTESSPPKAEVFEDDAFGRLGFADASILRTVEAATDVHVLTDDAKLYTEVLYRGSVAVNFNHVRPTSSG